MLDFALLVTLPLVPAIGIAGFLGARVGPAGLWLTVAGALGFAELVGPLSAAGATAIATDEVAFIVAIYGPPLILGALVLSMTGLSRLTPGRIGLIAVIVAGANLFLAQFSFVLGCAANWWDCP